MMGLFSRSPKPKRPPLRERLKARPSASPAPPGTRQRRKAAPAAPLDPAERHRRAGLFGSRPPPGGDSAVTSAPSPAPRQGVLPGGITPGTPLPAAADPGPARPDRYGQIVRMLRDPDYRNAVKAELEQRREAVRSRQAARLARARARPRKPAPPGAADGVPARPGSRKKK